MAPIACCINKKLTNSYGKCSPLALSQFLLILLQDKHKVLVLIPIDIIALQSILLGMPYLCKARKERIIIEAQIPIFKYSGNKYIPKQDAPIKKVVMNIVFFLPILSPI